MAPLFNILALLVLIAWCTTQINPINCLKLGNSDINEAALPRGLAGRLSPLSSSAISLYTTFLRDGSLAQHAATFCDASGITCSDGYKASTITPYRNIYWAGRKASTILPYRNIYWASPGTADSKIWNRNTTDQEVRDVRNKHVYFREKELVDGGQLLVSSLANAVPPRPFLPQAIASKLPFSTRALPHLSQLLGIPTNSYLFKSMTLSMQQCETQRIGEDKMCATSLENMLQFGRLQVLDKVGGEIEMLSSDTAATLFPQMATLQQVTVKVAAERKSVVCHDVMFPFALYSCHHIPETKVYQVSWSTSGETVRAAAVCHMNTTGFDATHPAFAALYMKPGDGEVCHWVDEDNVVMWSA